MGGNGVAVESEILERAFSSFSEAAHSLERSYGLLRAEVARLRKELEASNSDLGRSLEENLRMRRDLDHILEKLPCGVLVVRGDSISHANPEARRLLGLCAGVGPECAAQTLDSLRPEIRDLLLKVRDREQEDEQEQEIAGEAQGCRWLALRPAPLGEGAGSVFIVRDVSERKGLQQAQARLERDQALAEITALLAHEVRNPLASLELFAGLLAESALAAECRSWVERIQSGLRSLSVTVNNVLQFHSSPPGNKVAVELGDLLTWARDFFAPLSRQHRVQILLRNSLQGVSMMGDRHRLQQVLSNLVLNAISFMPGGGWIRIAGKASADGGSALMEIADTGPGIAANDLGQIFVPGFSTRSGPGLGLAVCRQIVEQHGGSIGVSSRPGAGAKFSLSLPLLANEAPGESAS